MSTLRPGSTTTARAVHNCAIVCPLWQPTIAAARTGTLADYRGTSGNVEERRGTSRNVGERRGTSRNVEEPATGENRGTSRNVEQRRGASRSTKEASMSPETTTGCQPVPSEARNCQTHARWVHIGHKSTKCFINQCVGAHSHTFSELTRRN